MSQKDNKQGILNEAIRERLQERIHSVDSQENFLEGVAGTFEKEKMESDHNKKLYFLIETIILILSASMTLFSAVGSGGNWPVPVGSIFGIISAITSAIITCLIGFRGLCQWQETWLRHRNCLNLFYIECYQYAYYIGKYEEYTEEAEVKPEEERILYEKKMLAVFKKEVLAILIQNHEKFMKNMNKSEESGSFANT